MHPAIETGQRGTGCQQWRTRGMDEMNHAFTRLIRSHAADLAEPCPDFASELDYAPLPRLTVSRARVAAPMTVHAHPADAFLVFGAVDRPVHLAFGGRARVIPRGAIDVVPPGIPFTLHVPPDGGRNLLLQIESGFLESMVADAWHVNVSRPLQFDADTRGHDPGEGRFLELAQFVFDELMQDGPLSRDTGQKRRLEELLATALLGVRSHNYSARLDDARAHGVAPRFMRRAEDYLHAHAAQALTLADVAAAAAVSTRTLMRGFQRHHGCGPATYLRALRLEHCRRDLQAAPPGDTSVTAVAMAWGFHNIGRFARLYRDRFGENPVDTLRRAPRR